MEKNDKTKVIHTDSGDKDKKDKDQKTVVLLPDDVENGKEKDQKTVVLSEDHITDEKSAMVFSIDDLTSEMRFEDEKEKLDSKEQSKILKNLFPEKTEDEQVRINRNFLNDAEPFILEKFVDEIKGMQKGLSTGLETLDHWISVPQRSITLIASRPKHGKTIFMLNMLLNMTRIYQKKHFLFYAYEESRRDIETKFINISGEQCFSNKKNIRTNLDRWKSELKNSDVSELLEKSAKNIEYRGLQNFIEISNRIHVIDSNYNIVDLVDSIRTFNNTFELGAVFLDCIQKIRYERDKIGLSRYQQLQEVSNHLKRVTGEMKFPLISGAQITTSDSKEPEYDVLSEHNLREWGDLEQVANLIVGLQNYSKSRFIGSNVNRQFKSRFFGRSMENATPMPEYFKDDKAETVMLAKVFANRDGYEPDVELLFNRELLKITDLKDKDIQIIKKEL